MKVMYKNEMKIPAKIWTDELSSMESGALDQAELVCSQDWASRASFMPDMHLGKGCTIGAVIGTKNTLVPELVGVDIGCFDKDTEFLSPTGWKKISTYKNEKVAQFDPVTGIAEFIKPKQYQKIPCDEFIQIKTKYGIDQLLSEEHRCLVYKYDRKGKYEKSEVILAKSLMDKHNLLKLGFRDRFLTSFSIKTNTSIKYSDEMIRLITMISADGTKNGNKWIFRFKKMRKITRAKFILSTLGFPFYEKEQKDGVTCISFEDDNLTKGLEQFWNASPHQLKVISEECLNWDGNSDEQCFYTRRKIEADFIHYAFCATGEYRSVLRVDKHKKDGKLDYRVFRLKNTKVGIAGTPKKIKIKYVKSIDGYKYCFSVPTSFLVMRRNGNIFITGNCGMNVVETTALRETFDNRDFGELIKRIKKQIPMGFNIREKAISSANYGIPEIGHAITHVENIMNSTPKWLKIALARSKTIEGRVEKLAKYLGTLGGGNHFIELQADAEGKLHIMLHSGSRGPGEAIAFGFIHYARELNEKWNSRGSRELSHLPADSDEGQLYLEGVKWAQDFAYFNRAVMMQDIKKIIFDYCAERGYTIPHFKPMINIHHNYVNQENHNGENLWVHRKGATRVRDNITGIIPGSMGTKSYIVTGTNNVESMNSCSHGAGRAMGRKFAKNNLDIKGFQESMKNVISHDVNHSHIDESPAAYKSIDWVIAQQTDLIKIEKELIPIANIKA